MLKKSLLTMLLLAIFAPWAVGQNNVYQKVTASQTDWSGTYLLVNTAAGRAAVDGISYYMLNTTSVTINGTEISTLGSAALVTIESAGDNYKIKVGDRYLKRYNASSSNLQLYESWEDSNLYKWIITYSDGIVIKSASTNTVNYLYFSTQYNQFGLQSGSSTVDFYKETAGSNYQAPPAVTIGTVTGHTAEISWVAPTTSNTINGYAYQYKKHEVSTWGTLVEVSAATLSCTLEGLDPETEYDFQVKALYTGDTENNFRAASFTTIEACPTPTDLICTAYNATTATLGWSDTGAGSYDLYVTDDENDVPNQSSDATHTSNTNSKTIESLTAETPYYAYVRANCGGTDGKSDWSAVCSFTPSAAQNLTVNNTGTSTTSNYVPLYGYYTSTVGTEGQYIIPASALNDVKWGEIKKLTVYAQSNHDFGGTFEVRLAELDATTLDALYTGTMTTVYSGPLAVTGDDHAMEIEFTTNYMYTGKNLLVGICVSSAATGSSFTYPWVGISTSTNTAFYHYVGYSTYNYSVKFLPTTTITYIPGEEPECYPPTGLTYNSSTITESSVDLSWTISSNTTSCTLHYREIGTETWLEKTDLVSPTSYTLSGLKTHTQYEYQVRALCNGENTEWSESCTFSTDCGAYAIPYSYDFESSFDLECWTEIKTGTTGISASGGYPNSGAAYMFAYKTTTDQYLISPELSGITSVGVKVTFYYKRRGSYAEPFKVGYSTTGKAVSDFEGKWGDELSPSSNSTYDKYSQVFPAGTKYIAIYYPKSNNYGLYIDNISFTIPENTFTDEGDWNDATKWSYGTLPTDADNVLINAACTIPADCIAEANSITFGANGSLTIADGGQLITNTAVTATVEKNISAYSEATGMGNTDGWYFIATPINTTGYAPTTANMTINTYDFYYLDPSNTMWVNYNGSHNPGFGLQNGKGYLYANSNGTTISFTGEVLAADGNAGVSLLEGWNLIGNPYTYNAYVNEPYYKMNEARTGIEFVENNAAIAPCTGIVVEATEARNVTFTKNQSNTPETSLNNGFLNITVAPASLRASAGSAAAIDKAIVSFNKGSQLGKFYFGTQAASLYIPQGDKEYAIANTEAQGEIPVNFKANQDGQYTITVSPVGVEMNYLHLIDNMTGADVDLLALRQAQGPASYTFTAKTTDYESRFRLVFFADEAVSEPNEAFAFISNGALIIANEGQATLQVIDITGRILSSEAINGSVSKAINATPGLYVICLVDGENVKTQKIVVR